MMQMQNIVIKPVKPVNFIQCQTIITKNSVDILPPAPMIIKHLMHLDYQDFCTMIDRLARFWKHGGRLQGKTADATTVIIEDGTNNIHIMVTNGERWVEIEKGDADTEGDYKMMEIVTEIQLRCDNGDETYLYPTFHYMYTNADLHVEKARHVLHNFDAKHIKAYTDAEIPNELAEFIDDYL